MKLKRTSAWISLKFFVMKDDLTENSENEFKKSFPEATASVGCIPRTVFKIARVGWTEERSPTFQRV